MVIGIDFDNTLIDYGKTFHDLAAARALIPPGAASTKSAVRDLVRRRHGDRAWHALQAAVYGPEIHRGALMEGAADCIRALRSRNARLVIVSHKTRYAQFRGAPPEPGAVPLRDAALCWMRDHHFFSSLEQGGLGFRPEDVHFEATRQAKAARIAALGCAVFVDDLPELLAMLDDSLERILFLRNRESPPTHDAPCDMHGDWRAIMSHLAPSLPETPLLQGYDRLCARTMQGGRNSRVVFLRDDVGQPLVMKHYFDDPRDSRDRQGAEASALRLLEAAEEPAAPRLLALDTRARISLMTFIPGRAAPPATPHFAQCAAHFLLRLQEYSRRETNRASAMAPASEAHFSPAAVERHVAARLERLAPACAQGPLHHALADFIRLRLTPAMKHAGSNARRLLATHAGAWDETLASRARILSPSDFGAHNAVQRPDGRIVFLDFEYFGWDDPAKTVADFLLHPGMMLDESSSIRFLTTLFPGGDRSTASTAFDAHAARRLMALLPFFAVKWCCILLNEFVNVDAARRGFATGVTDPRPPNERRLAARLASAETILRGLPEKARCVESTLGP